MRKTFFEIVYEDNDLIVVDKAAGVYSIDPRHPVKDQVLTHLLRKGRDEIFVLHRLDRETSGLILFAKNKESHKELSRQFEHNEIQKKYYAFVDGRLEFEGAYLIDVPILITPGKYKVQIADSGKPAKTKIRVVENYNAHTMVEAKLITGRTHQIRAHLQYIGHPLMVDKLYGFRSEFYLSEIKKKYRQKTDSSERPLINRQTLHAHNISLKHPISQEPMTFEAKLPKDLRALRSQLLKN